MLIFEDEKGLVTIEKLHNDILCLKRNPLCDQMISLMNIEYGGNAFSFGDWVNFICKYCMYGVSEMLLLVFMMFEENERCNFAQFKQFCQTMNEGIPSPNMDAGLRSMKVDYDGYFTFEALYKMNRMYPLVMYPVFKVRIAMMRASLGERWYFLRNN